MEIRQEILEKHLAEAAIEQLADDYARQGFEVERGVQIGGDIADLVARRGGEILVFEVKTGRWTPEKRETARRLRDHAVQEQGARFVLVLAPPPRDKSLEIEGIEEVLQNLIEKHDQSELSDVSSHTRVAGVTDVDLTSIVAGAEWIEVTGSGSVELELQFGSDSDLERDQGFTSHEAIPFAFHVLLDGDLKPKQVLSLELDLDDFRS
jgi:Holliday junction resolvase